MTNPEQLMAFLRWLENHNARLCRPHEHGVACRVPELGYCLLGTPPGRPVPMLCVEKEALVNTFVLERESKCKT